MRWLKPLSRSHKDFLRQLRQSDPRSGRGESVSKVNEKESTHRDLWRTSGALFRVFVDGARNGVRTDDSKLSAEVEELSSSLTSLAGVRLSSFLLL